MPEKKHITAKEHIWTVIQCFPGVTFTSNDVQHDVKDMNLKIPHGTISGVLSSFKKEGVLSVVSKTGTSFLYGRTGKKPKFSKRKAPTGSGACLETTAEALATAFVKEHHKMAGELNDLKKKVVGIRLELTNSKRETAKLREHINSGGKIWTKEQLGM